MTSEVAPRDYRRSTMRDVAAIANVSAKTVSRVINGEKYVSSEIEERVRAAMAQLNYRHNMAARQLRSRATAAAVGLVLVDISNPFSSALHRAVEDVFTPRGINVLASSTDEDSARERAAVETFTARRVDGLILMPASHDHGYLAPELRAGTPMVMVDRPSAGISVDSVVSGNEEGARRGVHHLIEHGHRRIGFLGDLPEVISSEMRHRGYLRALQDAGVKADDRIVHRGFDAPEDAYQACSTMLEAPDAPSAIFVAQNALCIPVVRALQHHGRQQDVAVVGFDGFEGADLVAPGLTVVAQDPSRMGRLAAEILAARMSPGTDAPVEDHVLETTLVERGSGEIPAPPA